MTPLLPLSFSGPSRLAYGRPETFSELLRDLWRCIRRDPPTLRERQVAAGIVERMAVEFEQKDAR
jgi:hypothetical protein